MLSLINNILVIFFYFLSSGTFCYFLPFYLRNLFVYLSNKSIHLDCPSFIHSEQRPKYPSRHRSLPHKLHAILPTDSQHSSRPVPLTTSYIIELRRAQGSSSLSSPDDILFTSGLHLSKNHRALRLIVAVKKTDGNLRRLVSSAPETLTEI